jgi:hypothetical protein
VRSEFELGGGKFTWMLEPRPSIREHAVAGAAQRMCSTHTAAEITMKELSNSMSDVSKHL